MPWHRRFFDALPRLPDWFLPVVLIVLACLAVFLAGAMMQATVDVHRAADRTTTELQERQLHLRIEALEQRVKALEAKEAP